MNRGRSQVRVRLFAAARAAADGENDVAVSAGSLAEVCACLIDLFGAPMASVLERSSFLVNDVAWARRDHDRALADGSTVDVLPPFAGG